MASETTTLLPALPDFASVFNFNERISNLEKDLSEMKQVDQSSSQPQSLYEPTAILYDCEITKILINKMEKNKSFDIANYKRELYDALVKSYSTNKDIFESYGEVFSLKRSQDNKDKDQDPSNGSDRVMKRRKSSKDAESSIDSRHATRSRVVTRDNDEQLVDKEVTKADWFKKPERPPTPDPD
nr:hypothetical protein [Tanacetum cinerariifolium]